MPFVLMCGTPSSGKTTLAKELEKYLVEEHDSKVIIINDELQNVDKNEVYCNSGKEKDLRGKLKSSVQRQISKDCVVILDSLNYIKGFRYELYCVTKSAQTPQCVIFTDINPSTASVWNAQRPADEQYNQEVFDGLVMRFEPPNSQSRWDSPLFSLLPGDSLPLEQIKDALFHKKAPPPNMSTQSQPLSSTNFLHELDKITQPAVASIIAAQKTGVPGDKVSIPGASEKVVLYKSMTLAELQRVRRQFISFAKLRPVEDSTKLANMFVQFFNNTSQ